VSTEAPPAAEAPPAPYPVHLDARLDDPLSRWLWLVKWFLAIPHYILLVFLWIAAFFASVFAFFAILFTGRYPQTLFYFNLGVLRWTWRVQYYSFTAVGTDRYPPFSLDPEPDYPATLDIEYPAELSHWKPLLKWLFAFPHWFAVAAFAGWSTSYGNMWFHIPGAISALTFVSLLILLVKERYPQNLHTLIIGMSRWCLRVGVYVAFMTDEYPPFRLED